MATKLKAEFLVILLIILTFAFLFTFLLIAHLYARRQVKKSISATAHMLHTYMHHDLDSNDVFPPAYAEVATQIVQIKSCPAPRAGHKRRG